ncbi:MAG: hypothetical protein GVY07_10525 [Bacteroidetes bacterium]|nr:hypothetical protein [Bacteroidota bacterium]
MSIQEYILISVALGYLYWLTPFAKDMDKELGENKERERKLRKKIEAQKREEDEG